MQPKTTNAIKCISYKWKSKAAHHFRMAWVINIIIISPFIHSKLRKMATVCIEPLAFLHLATVWTLHCTFYIERWTNAVCLESNKKIHNQIYRLVIEDKLWFHKKRKEMRAIRINSLRGNTCQPPMQSSRVLITLFSSRKKREKTITDLELSPT